MNNCRTVYPSKQQAFPAATFFTFRDELDYISYVQKTYPGNFGICSCTAKNFEKHQPDVIGEYNYE